MQKPKVPSKLQKPKVIKTKVNDADKIETPKSETPRLCAADNALCTQLQKVAHFTNQVVFEREAETEGLIVAILSGTSSLFIGAPGAGKTFHTKFISKLFGLSVFDTLMSETTKPDSIFGPTDVPALAKGIQRTKIKGYAPDSEILFFDEIFKASGIILNPLLWLINEHEYRNGDEGVLKCPTKAVFAASNELPTEESLAALYDRFLLRYQIGYIKSRENLNKMLDAESLDESEFPTMQSHEIDRLRELTKTVIVPKDLRDRVYTMRDILQSNTGVSISDRRLVQSFKILKAKALFNGRLTVQIEDLAILANVFWAELDQIPRVKSIVSSLCNVQGMDDSSYSEVANNVWNEALKTGEMDSARKRIEAMCDNVAKLGNDGKQILNTLNDILTRIDGIIEQRNRFVVYIMPHEDTRTIFKIGGGTDGLWAPKQLRSVGFKHFKRGNYWWMPAYTEKTKVEKRKEIRKLLKTTVRDKLGAEVIFNKI